MEVRELLTVAVMAALPTYGLISGAAFAPLCFGLVGLLAIYDGITRRTLPVIDYPLAGLAAIFVLFAWAGLIWAAAPSVTLKIALQVSGVVTGALLVLSVSPGAVSNPVRRVALIGLAIGPAVMVADVMLGFPLMAVVHNTNSHDSIDSHYNRGLCYLVLMFWPVALWTWTQRFRFVLVGPVVCLAAAVMVGSSKSAELAFGIGGAAFVAAWLAPRWSAAVLAVGMTGFALGLPWIGRQLLPMLKPLAVQIKPSAVHRLEIWDYMSTEILKHPWLGLGFGGSKHVWLSTETLARYTYVTGESIHPHNQWLQLWLDGGVAGELIGLCFFLFVLRRVFELSVPVRPFAFAALVSALVFSMVGIELYTDSWWAALALTAGLFAATQPKSATQPAAAP
ncbi:MAG: O-antigen ligase family protein [Rhodospirillaceae bacterium]